MRERLGIRLLAFGAAFGAACTPDKLPGDSALAPTVPDNFLFGAAIAGFQVDPGCPSLPAEQCEDQNSDWYQWVTDPELIAISGLHLSGDPLSMGPGHWELYEQDFALAADELNLGALRTSIEWSRLFPTSPGDVTTVDELAELADPDAVAAYHAYFSAMRAAGLEPMVTLNHYTLPLWIHDGKACHEDPDTCEARGWLDPETLVPAMALYAGFCAREFGGQVDIWATLNEPFAVVLAGYLLPGEDRTNPPGIINPSAAIDVAFAMIDAHAAMYDAVHANDPTASVGLVPNLVVAVPEDPTRELDVVGAEHLDYVYNRLFLEALVHGRYDRDVDGVAEETRPDLAGRMDFIGVNYYTRLQARGLGFSFVEGYEFIDFLPVGSFWDSYPEGLGQVARLAADYGLPVYITENGTADHSDAGAEFLIPHLASLQDAIDDGVDIRGYFLWSLIDNGCGSSRVT
jgi:beta-galactosidase